MLANPHGKTANIICRESAFPEFPELLFGAQSDNGPSFFDATAYIQSKGLRLSVADFFKSYETPITALRQAYLMEESDVRKVNGDGHILIDGNFVYLFISFVEPEFLAYMNDRIHELFRDGHAVSDTHLLEMARRRLSHQALKTILDNEGDKA
jgi:hypothetical protein